MAGAYLVTLPAQTGMTLPQGANAMVVYAEDANDAKDICKNYFTGDSNAAWEAATATAIAAAADLAGFTLRAGILGQTPVVHAEVTGAASATIDTLGTALAAALNALPNIAAAAYNTSTQVLTIAGVADELGDQQGYCELLGPGGVPVAGFAGAVTDGGVAEDPVTCTLAADARAKPQVVAAVKLT